MNVNSQENQILSEFISSLNDFNQRPSIGKFSELENVVIKMANSQNLFNNVDAKILEQFLSVVNTASSNISHMEASKKVQNPTMIKKISDRFERTEKILETISAQAEQSLKLKQVTQKETAQTKAKTKESNLDNQRSMKNNPLNHGSMGREDAEKLLAKCQVGEGLLRWSEKQKDFVISRKMGQDKYFHYQADGRSLEKLMQDVGIIGLIDPKLFEKKGADFYKSNSHGSIEGTVAEVLLRGCQVGEGFVRWSETQKDFFISKKTGENQYIHYQANGKSLEKLMKDAGMQSLIIPGSFKSNNEDLYKLNNHGPMDRAAAEKLLSAHKVGDAILRWSDNGGSYVISYKVQENQYKHYLTNGELLIEMIEKLKINDFIPPQHSSSRNAT